MYTLFLLIDDIVSVCIDAEVSEQQHHVHFGGENHDICSFSDGLWLFLCANCQERASLMRFIGIDVSQNAKL